MSVFFTIVVVFLIFLIIFQISKASEYVAVLKGEEKSIKQNNKINGFFMIAFLILGLIGIYWCHQELYGKTLFPQGAASPQGEKVDSMLVVTIIITGIAFFITQILLFWFSYKYQHSDTRKPLFFPHNNTMELVWTVVPAITLTILIVIGLRNWFDFTSEAPKNAIHVEVTGKQFGWIFRYPGKDKVFGKKYYKIIDDANSNPLGQIFTDSAAFNLKADPANYDDVVVTSTMYAVKDRPLNLIIFSRDVIHSVGLVHFRMKMDAVPGIPTSLWFTPKYTTKEMKERTGNPDFVYEISCDQLCGSGHYSMRGIIEVVTQAEYDAWLLSQKPNYYAAHPEKDPASMPKPQADSTVKAVAGVGTTNSNVSDHKTKM